MVAPMLGVPTSFAPAELRGDGLTCRRGGRTVFAKLHFTLKNGDALVLRGPNGSGKTTLLRLMAGFVRPKVGFLTWNNVEIRAEAELFTRNLRFIGHLDAVKPGLTVSENLGFWHDLWCENPTETPISDALKAFGLTHLTDYPARLLSAGQRHRLALARVLIGTAPLWLLDEPANALDDAAIAALSTAIAVHRSKGGMVVLAGHGAVPVSGGQELFLDRFAPPPVNWDDET